MSGPRSASKGATKATIHPRFELPSFSEPGPSAIVMLRPASREGASRASSIDPRVCLLQGRAPKTCRRDRWTDADAALCEIGMLAAVHGLLKIVYPEWAASYGSRLPSRLPGPLESAEGLQFLEDEPGREQIHGNEDAPPRHAQCEDAGAASEETFRQRLASDRLKALVFVSMLAFEPRFLILSVVLMRQQALMRGYLFLASEQADADEDGKFAFAVGQGMDFRKKGRTLRKCLAELERGFLEALASLLSEAKAWLMLPRASYYRENTALAFRLISAAGASAHKHLLETHT